MKRKTQKLITLHYFDKINQCEVIVKHITSIITDYRYDENNDLRQFYLVYERDYGSTILYTDEVILLNITLE